MRKFRIPKKKTKYGRKALGRKLVKIRTLLGMSILEFAKALGESPVSYARYEAGSQKPSRPHKKRLIKNLQKLISRLGVKVNVLDKKIQKAYKKAVVRAERKDLSVVSITRANASGVGFWFGLASGFGFGLALVILGIFNQIIR